MKAKATNGFQKSGPLYGVGQISCGDRQKTKSIKRRETNKKRLFTVYTGIQTPGRMGRYGSIKNTNPQTVLVSNESGMAEASCNKV